MKRILRNILLILMGIQIALGVCYLITNVTHIQQFETGCGFPEGVPFFLLYPLQVILLTGSVWFFLGSFSGLKHKVLRGYITAYLVTVPVLLQMTLAHLSFSLALSALLWMLGSIPGICFDGFTVKRGILLGAAYFCYGLLCRDGLWLGAAVLLTAVFFGRRNGENTPVFADVTGRRKGYLLTVFITATAILAGSFVLRPVLEPERDNRIQNSFQAAMLNRFVWPHFGTNYFFWSDEIKAVISEEDAMAVSWRDDGVETKFGPAIEAAYGKRKANSLYLEMAVECFRDRTKEILTEIGRDFRDYALIPFTIERNLKGQGVSQTAWNYGRMRAYTPMLVKYYFRYGLFELPVLLLLTVLLKIKNIKSKFNIRTWYLGKLLLFTAFWYVFWYTMRSNAPIDYRLVLPVIFIWYLAAVGGLYDEEEKPVN